MADAAIEQVAAAFEGRPGVTRGRSFSAESLTVDDKIFAIFHRDGMVFKLPAERCQALLADGMGTPFNVGKRVMKEWIVVPENHADQWLPLADEAYTFVGQQ